MKKSDQKLPVPAELAHLIEKREKKERRSTPRRKQAERREISLGPAGVLTSGTAEEDVPLEDRRTVEERRAAKRRQKGRRK
jgi:hypothetical protein